jgi:hypothetical protein
VRYMTHTEFNAFCRTLPVATYVVQWAGRMSGKSVAKSSQSQVRRMTNRAFPSSERHCYEMLKDQPGLRPAPISHLVA